MQTPDQGADAQDAIGLFRIPLASKNVVVSSFMDSNGIFL